VLSELDPSIPQKVITIAYRKKLTGVDDYEKILTIDRSYL